METYEVDGRTFRVGELCLFRRWVATTYAAWLSAEVLPTEPGDPPYWLRVRCEGDWCYAWPNEVLLLSENFSPGV